MPLTTEQLEQWLTWLEGMIAKAAPKDLPALNQTYQRVLDELVRRDLEAADNGKNEGSDSGSQSH